MRNKSTGVSKKQVRRLRRPKSRRRGISLIFAIASMTAPSAIAVSQEAPGANTSLGPLTLTPNQGSEPAGDALSPQRLLQLFYQLQTSPGTNLNGEPDTVTKETFKLRGDLSVNLSSQWQLVFRGDLPYVGKNPISDSNPEGNYLYGLGDADIQATVIHQFDDRWKAGAGVRLIAPTGGDAFGSGKWQVMPIPGFRYALPEISRGSYFEPFARYDVSFAGDPTRRNRRRSAASSATRRTSRRGCRGSPSPTAWSSPRAGESFSAISSSFRTSELGTSRGSPDRRGSGRRCGRVRSQTTSLRCTEPASRRSSGGKKNATCCCGGGRGRRAAKVRWSCFRARPGSANRGLPPRCSNASPVAEDGRGGGTAATDHEPRDGGADARRRAAAFPGAARAGDAARGGAALRPASRAGTRSSRAARVAIRPATARLSM